MPQSLASISETGAEESDADRRRRLLEALIARNAEAERRDREAKAKLAEERAALPIWKRDQQRIQMKTDALNRSRNDAEGQELEGCTFQPEINARSRNLPTRKHVSMGGCLVGDMILSHFQQGARLRQQ